MEDIIRNYELEVFLGGTFHQDIESLESALDEYIEEEQFEYIIQLTEEIELFLKSDKSVYCKEQFIKKNTDIYFPGINRRPIEWLEEVLEKLKNVRK